MSLLFFTLQQSGESNAVCVCNLAVPINHIGTNQFGSLEFLSFSFLSFFFPFFHEDKPYLPYSWKNAHFNQPLSPNLDSVIQKELGWPISPLKKPFFITAENPKKTGSLSFPLPILCLAPGKQPVRTLLRGRLQLEGGSQIERRWPPGVQIPLSLSFSLPPAKNLEQGLGVGFELSYLKIM